MDMHRPSDWLIVAYEYIVVIRDVLTNKSLSYKRQSIHVTHHQPWDKQLLIPCLLCHMVPLLYQRHKRKGFIFVPTIVNFLDSIKLIWQLSTGYKHTNIKKMQ